MTDRDKEFFLAVSKLVAFIADNRIKILSELDSDAIELLRLNEQVINSYIAKILCPTTFSEVKND